MNTQAPHDLLSALAVAALPPEQRKNYVYLPEKHVEAVRAMNPEQRAAFLKEHPLDALRLERAAERRARRQEKRARG